MDQESTLPPPKDLVVLAKPRAPEVSGNGLIALEAALSTTLQEAEEIAAESLKEKRYGVAIDIVGAVATSMTVISSLLQGFEQSHPGLYAAATIFFSILTSLYSSLRHRFISNERIQAQEDAVKRLKQIVNGSRIEWHEKYAVALTSQLTNPFARACSEIISNLRVAREETLSQMNRTTIESRKGAG